MSNIKEEWIYTLLDVKQSRIFEKSYVSYEAK